MSHAHRPIWPPTGICSYFWRANFDRRHGRPAAALRPRLLLSRTSTRGSAEGGERRRSSRYDGSGNFYAAASTVPSHAKVIVFSKDRPWQLQQLLRSMDLSHSSLPSSAKAPPPVASIDVHIIARVVEPFVDGYRMVQDEFEGFHVSNRNDTTSTDSAKVSLSFLREDDGVCSFECLLERVINEEKFQEVADNFVMFLKRVYCNFVFFVS